jgi:hypothetical protein
LIYDLKRGGHADRCGPWQASINSNASIIIINKIFLLSDSDPNVVTTYGCSIEKEREIIARATR